MDSLPADIRGKRHCYDFEGFSLTSRNLARNRAFEGAMREMAAVIHERKRLFDQLGADPTAVCDQFAFPSGAAVLPATRRAHDAAAASAKSGRYSTPVRDMLMRHADMAPCLPGALRLKCGLLQDTIADLQRLRATAPEYTVCWARALRMRPNSVPSRTARTLACLLRSWRR
jgi:hypothetical protein